ncbi:MAG: M23 family metallopeptidase [Rikenellaceae bacterium]
MTAKKTKRNRTAQLRRRKRLRSNIWRLLLRSLVWIGAAVLYYSLYSLFLDTPYEYNLRHSTDRLRQEYTILQQRYDSLTMVMDNIVERDRGVFRTLFESEPYDFSSVEEETNIRRYEELLRMSSDELRRELNSRTSSLETTCQEMITSKENLVAKMERVGKDASNIPSIQPIVNEQLTLLTASYGMRIHPFYKKLQHHQGVDFTIPEGTRVFATADGVVKNVTLRNSTEGKTIVLDHGNGYETSYSHLNIISVPRGRSVKKGDIIGHSGNTGLSLVPHLHYEVKFKGVRVDPIHYFFGELSPQGYQRIISIAQSGMQSFD